MTNDDADRLVERYLDRLELACRGLPSSRRRELVGEIDRHIRESRARAQPETVDTVREILERTGRPDEIVASAGPSQPAGEPRHRPWRRLVPVALGAVVLLAAVAIGVAVSPRTSTTTRSQSASVPGVLGRSEPAAVETLAREGFRYAIAIRPFGAESAGPQGTVLAQFPPGGTAATRGTTVTLDVAGRTSVPTLTVPDLVGQTVTSAFRQLRAIGLAGGTPVSCTMSSGCGIQELVVAAQSPAAGERAPKGSLVNLTSRRAG